MDQACVIARVVLFSELAVGNGRRFSNPSRNGIDNKTTSSKRIPGNQGRCPCHIQNNKRKGLPRTRTDMGPVERISVSIC